MVVCAACHTTLYREADVLRQGKESVLGEPRSSLYTGAVGRVGDRGIEILGRTRSEWLDDHFSWRVIAYSFDEFWKMAEFPTNW